MVVNKNPKSTLAEACFDKKCAAEARRVLRLSREIMVDVGWR